MNKLIPAIAFLIFFTGVSGQDNLSEEFYRNYFSSNKDSLVSIEGIWLLTSNKEVYHYDTLVEVISESNPSRVVIWKKQGKLETKVISGSQHRMEFSLTDVKGVYLYRNYYPETKEYSKNIAVICKSNEMNYSYEIPENIIRIRDDEDTAAGTKIIVILMWKKAFPLIN